jgi:serpin B
MKVLHGTISVFNLAALFFLMIAVIAPACLARAAVTASDAVSAANSLAAELYGKLAASGGGENFCFSPYSISSALAMTYAGAAGDTAGEMEKNLGFSSGIHASEASLRERLTAAPGGAEIFIANSIWPQNDYRFLKSFTGLLKESYGAELIPVDFKGQPESARRQINGWVSERTKDKITDILPPESVGPDSRLVLVNAIYFKAAWQDEFQKSATSDQEFFLSGGGSVMTPMMRSVRRAGYFETDGFQAVRLPYRGSAFSMTIVLPKKKDGLASLEGDFGELGAGLLEDFRSKPKSRRVDLSIPKFRAESTFSLADALKGLGVRSAFDDNAADFSLMNGKGGLYIGAVAHKAFVDVDEEGTEAAAATAIGMARMTAVHPEEPPVVFRADHPFLFLIEDAATGTVLFMGRVARP